LIYAVRSDASSIKIYFDAEEFVFGSINMAEAAVFDLQRKIKSGKRT
jgi:hypothetical protein